MATEFDLIRRFFSRPAKNAVLGVGDDCALWSPGGGMLQAVSTDMLIEGRHFLAGTDAEKLGRKSLAVNLSDLAAMGADPRYALLAIALPGADEKWLEAFARGFFTQADRHGVELIGGDTTRGPLAISITAIGEVPLTLALRRDAALAGDEVWVSGATGGAALALAHQQGRVSLAGRDLLECFARLDDPEPRVDLGGRLRGIARAAIDISDGLLADLGHIAESSGVGIDIAADRLPVIGALRDCSDVALRWQCIAAGGDDYELAFTAPRNQHAALDRIGAELGLALTAIGSVVPGASVVTLRDSEGMPIKMARTGFDHFNA
ncbi:MAG: thiamine-phosphate kinase [Betaproteobacteria bacterium]|nr:thiamine-phosphate kinase [Betaproteobacteria bacterium]